MLLHMADPDSKTELGQYRIVEKIGEGGMGQVWLAEDVRLKRKVAIKLLPESLAGDSSRLKRFEQEALAASALNHPNILTIYEFGQSNDSHFLVSEFVDGETLRDKLKSGPLTLDETVNIALQSATALGAAHTAGIIHRDIKPENLMLRRDGYVKVLDFGLAKIVDALPADEEERTRKMGLTEAGTVVGTVSYMSPEQARGLSLDPRSDLFSLGIVLYEMLTRKQPFTGETVNHVIVAILEREMPALPDAIPGDLSRIVEKLLKKKPEDRYASAADLAVDLKRVQTNLLRAVDFGATESDRTQAFQQSDSQSPVATQDSRPNPSNTEIKQKWSKWLLAALIVLAAGSAAGFFLFSKRGTESRQIESIAVLPFTNASKDAEVEYLSDGMTEELISSLAQLPNLNVKPRSTVFRYKGKDLNPQAIAKELNVQGVLNGRVVQRGQELTLFIELINTSLDKVVWSETYNRRQSDLVTLQADLARDVLGKIKARLSGADEAKVTKTYTNNPEAYQLYLKGNFYRTKYTEEGYRKSLEYYRQAIAKDPTYALAYHGIAAAYEFANGFFVPAKESMPKAKEAALKALELDESLAETHFLLGKIIFWYDWDWKAAEKEWQRAHELDPALPAIYPVYLSAMGRHEEAIKYQAGVQERLPLDLNVNLDTAGAYLWGGKTNEAIAQLTKTLELDPTFWWSHQLIGLAYRDANRMSEAISAMEKARTEDQTASTLGYLGHMYALTNRKNEALSLLEQLKAMSARVPMTSYSIACVYAGLKDDDQALKYLNLALQERSFYIALLKTEPIFRNLRSDLRYKEILRKANLPE